VKVTCEADIIDLNFDGFVHTALQLFGYSRSELFGRSIDTIIPHPFSKVHAGFMTAFVESGVEVRYHFMLIRSTVAIRERHSTMDALIWL
jgi:PAS domain S-box-containing protein